jgi:hypothetical protein
MFATFVFISFVSISLVSAKGGFKKVCTPEGVCGQCVSNADCSGSTPYCDTNTLTCQKCVTDIHCRHNGDCNSTCTNFQCVTGNRVCDTSTEVCYERQGLCLTKCNSDSFCLTIPYVLHYPNNGVCDINGTKKCYDCLITLDCNPQANISCGAQCSWSQEGLEYLCINSDTCKNGKSCTLANSAYVCSNPSSSQVIVYNYFLLLAIIAVVAT